MKTGKLKHLSLYSERGTEMRKYLPLAYFLLFTFVFLLPPPLLAAESAWDKLVAAAKKEGEVILWGDQEITHPDIVAAFSREYPLIKVVTVGGKAGELMPRLIGERRAGKFLADVYSGGLGGRAFFDFHRAGVLDPIKPILAHPEVVDESKWLGGRHYYADAEGRYVFMFEGNLSSVGLFYNTKLVNPAEFKSYWDILDPKWKGKIALFERPGVGSPSFLRFYYNAQLGPDFLRRLMTEMDLTVSQERRQATDWLGSGKFALCVDCADTDRAKKQGVPVDEFDRATLKEAGNEISTAGNSGLALIQKAAHPAAAALFINWYLSRQGQTVWQQVMNLKVVEPTNSMRIDIPKGDVLPEARRDDRQSYKVTGFLDPEPVQRLVNEVRKGK